MTTISRDEFIHAFGSARLDVQRAREDDRLAGVNLGAADHDHDGQISGRTEAGALFDMIDRLEVGAPDGTVRVRGEDHRPTPAGRAIGAVGELGGVERLRTSGPVNDTPRAAEYVERLQSDQASGRFGRVAEQVEGTFPPDITDPRRGYTSFRGGDRVGDRLRHLDSEAELEHVFNSFDRVQATRNGAAHLDRNLALAIAFRESGQQVLSRSSNRVDSFHAGGLDRLYGEARSLRRQGFLPPDVARGLERGSRTETEGSTASTERRAEAASIRQRDLLTAYGATVAERNARFERVAEEMGLDTSGLSQRGRRVWNAMFFGGPGGLGYDAYRQGARQHADEPGWTASHFGARTVVDYLARNGHSAEDVLRLHELNPELYEMTRVRSAFVVAAEAEVLDRYIPGHNPSVGPDNHWISAGR